MVGDGALEAGNAAVDGGVEDVGEAEPAGDGQGGGAAAVQVEGGMHAVAGQDGSQLSQGYAFAVEGLAAIGDQDEQVFALAVDADSRARLRAVIFGQVGGNVAVGEDDAFAGDGVVNLAFGLVEGDLVVFGDVQGDFVFDAFGIIDAL